MSDFYTIEHEGQELTLPRVTSILRVIDRSMPLMGWAVKIEREAVKLALEDVLTEPTPADGRLDPQKVWDRMQPHLSGKRASLKKQDEAANIGRAAHALIEWHTRRMMKLDVGDEPEVPDAALRAVLAWLDWVKLVDFQPIGCEKLVYCPRCAYGGTVDTFATVMGRLTLIDYKTSKAVYPEALLQVNFYRHAARSCGVGVEQTMVVRLPKTAEDPLPEMIVAPVVPLRCAQAILTAWRTMRWLNEEPYGTAPVNGMCKG